MVTVHAVAHFRQDRLPEAKREIVACGFFAAASVASREHRRRVSADAGVPEGSQSFAKLRPLRFHCDLRYQMASDSVCICHDCQRAMLGGQAAERRAIGDVDSFARIQLAI